MKKQATFITLFVAVVFIITFLPLNLPAQELAPDFTLADIQGKTFKLKDYRAKTVLLIFGTTWCPSCRSEIPHFKEIFNKYNPRGLEIAYVNIQESRDKVQRFSTKYQLPYRTLLDSTGEVADTYMIMGVPAMILIKDGKLVTRNYRLMDGYLEKMFKK